MSSSAGPDRVVDAAVAHLYLEKTALAPSVVPGIDTEPVVKSFLDAPTDHLYSVAALSLTGHVLVNSAAVGQEIHVDGESCRDSTVGHDLFLDAVDAIDLVEAVSLDLVAGVVNKMVCSARALALRLNCGCRRTSWQALNVDMVRTLRHHIVVAELALAIVTTGDDTLIGEPHPWGGDWATVAPESVAVMTRTARCGVRCAEEGRKITACSDALPIVEGLSGAVSPAATTVCLIAHMSNNRGALRPVLSCIEADWEFLVRCVVAHLTSDLNVPLRIHHGSELLADRLQRSIDESAALCSFPGGTRPGVDVLNVSSQINRH